MGWLSFQAGPGLRMMTKAEFKPETGLFSHLALSFRTV